MTDITTYPTRSVESLNDIGDVDTPSPGDGHVLKWKVGTQQWEAEADTSSSGLVTDHSDVTSAGSGAIITAGERSDIGTNTTNNTGTVTIHSDVTSAGSGAIITAQERTDINASIDVHSDVDITTDAPEEGEILVWRTDEFVPEPIPTPPSKTTFWLGPTASVGSGVDLPIFVVSPTRTNGSGVYTRVSDTEITIDTAGLHDVNITYNSSKSDELSLKVNGDTWVLVDVSPSGSFNMKYDFAASDSITINRIGGGTAVYSDITVSICRS